MNLHIIHKSASNHQSSNDALALISSEDSVIFIDDGIYNAIANTTISQRFSQTAKACYYIETHALARGITQLNTPFIAADMNDFVKLSLRAKNNISWY